jgi:glyoxalase family protein
MKLDGVHHVTAITGDAPGNVDFYTRVLGMRLVKKTVNQDDPSVYHLFYGDEQGSPGFDMTFFEYPGARRGRPGDGMVHTVAFRVPSAASLDVWAERVGGAGIAVQRPGRRARAAAARRRSSRRARRRATRRRRRRGPRRPADP